MGKAPILNAFDISPDVDEATANELMWCHLNDEGDLLERLVPGAVQISGSDSDDAKEDRFEAFRLGQA
ncbi:MAG: hypothetical protein WC683_20065, partial [bacterium]